MARSRALSFLAAPIRAAAFAVVLSPAAEAAVGVPVRALVVTP